MPDDGRNRSFKVEPDAMSPDADVPPSADDSHEQQFLRHFVDQYLTSRGFHVCSRNARVIVAALADCRPTGLDIETLERCVDRSVNPALLRRAA